MASTIHLGIGKICVAKCEEENGQIIIIQSIAMKTCVVFNIIVKKIKLKPRFHGGFTSVARSASLALEEWFSFPLWLATSRQSRQRACAIERASVELPHQLI
jgi:hypothetical protein